MIGLRLTLASNAIHLEAARRLRDGLAGRPAGLEILLWEPQRFSLSAADRQRWRWRLPVRPLSYLLLAPMALLGLVAELRLAHRLGAGLGLRLLLARARRLSLLDDGLDQYRAQPKAVDPLAFPAGLDCWLFSDAPAWRAPWCQRFRCRELGPLFAAAHGHPAAAPPPFGPPAMPPQGTLIIDSPGVERLESLAGDFPHPWRLVPHPVAAKRSWRLPIEAGDSCQPGAPEALLARWRGTVVVGESLMLLAALRLRPAGTRLVLGLPDSVDDHLRARVAQAAQGDPLVWLAAA
ncbi:MAG: hypothetical protein VKO44_11235 [Cyanobacteriota bacterium]|nr:hypothetical protein [Cyanobacteriota bacterium]